MVVTLVAFEESSLITLLSVVIVSDGEELVNDEKMNAMTIAEERGEGS